MPVIRISGNLGAGKTTVSKILAEKLGYKFISIGQIFRKIAKEKNLSLEVFYQNLSTEKSLETEIDDYQKKIINSLDNIVIEGRVTPFLPCKFKSVNILLLVDEEVGAKRQLQREENKDINQIIQESRERVENESAHYLRLYNIKNHLDPSSF